MEQKVFVVEGRQFRTKGDYARAVHDKELIDKLRKETDLQDKAQLEKLKADLKKGTYKFMTLLEQDFRDEVDELIRNAGAGKKTSGKKGSRNAKQQGAGKSGLSPGGIDASKQSQGEPEIDDAVKEELQKRERRRKLIIAACSVAAVCCLGYFGIYTYYDYRTNSTYEALSDLRLNRLPTTAAPAPAATPQFTLDETAPEPKEVLEEFKTLLNKNQKLIGWLRYSRQM